MRQFLELYRMEDDAGLPQQYAILAAHRAQVQSQIEALCDTLNYIDRKLAIYNSKLLGLGDNKDCVT